MLMQIDGTFIFAAISFLIFLFIIKTILYAPFSKIIDERQNFYDKNSKLEKESKEKSKKLVDEKEQAIKASRLEASDLIKEASKEGKEEQAKKLDEIKKEIKSKIEENNKNLTQQTNTAKEEIKKEVNSIVGSIISKIFKEQISVDIDEEKINKYIYR